VLAIFGVALVFVNDRVCRAASAGRIYRTVAEVPQNDVGVVLGTGRLTLRGATNLHFSQRIRAAAQLYHSGKVRHLLVSGDNHTAGYDEPTDMRNALVAAGVPAAAITRDCAGFRTLDSIERAKLVFGLTRYTIVTEEFHCPRAVWIARRNGIDAVAFAAPDVPWRSWALRVKVRECFARAWCGIDLYVLQRGPKFPGPPEPIVLASEGR
jgi:SanA protein